MEAMSGVSEALEYVDRSVKGHTFHADTVAVSWFIILIFLLFAFLLKGRISPVPGKLQLIFESILLFFDELAANMGGKRVKKYVPIIVCFFLFVTSCNWLGLFPAFVKVQWLHITMPPTRDISTTVALACCSFMVFQYVGYKEHGLKYLLHYVHPIPQLAKDLTIPPLFKYPLLALLLLLFIGINIMEELARVLSLSLRLMGNILGEHLLAGAFVGLVMICFTFPGVWKLSGVFADILPLFIMGMSLLMGLVQGFVFSLLTLSYVSTAVED